MSQVFESKYIEFEIHERKPKTDVYNILSKSEGDILGKVKWFPNWRQYTFFPEKGTVFSKGCLEDINRFLQKLKDDRRKWVKLTVVYH